MFPACVDLTRDREIARYPAAIRVYFHLVAEFPDIFFAPQEVKAWLVSDEIDAARNTVNRSIDLLLERGYALEHEPRAMNNVRRLTLIRVRPVKPREAV